MPAALVIEVWKAGGSALYMSVPADIWGWLYLPLSGLIYLFIQDTWFYFTHRIMHHRKLFKWTHEGLPLHVGMALFVLMLMTINAVFNHAGWEVYPDNWVKGLG